MAIENEKIEELFLDLMDRTEKTVSVLKQDFSAVRAGRANPHILDKVLVDYYGEMTPVNQVGNISVADAKCLVISPWDVSLLKELEKAILAANIGLTPTNDGKIIRLVFPDLTEERRRDLIKQIKKMAEDAKVAVRNVRRDAMDTLKKAKANKEISEDECAGYEKDVEKEVSKAIGEIEKAAADKEKDLMTV